MFEWQVMPVDRTQSDSEKLLISSALARYLDEVTPNKKTSTQAGDKACAKLLSAHFGRYSLASFTTDKIAAFRYASKRW